jgi:hypothetical protein
MVLEYAWGPEQAIVLPREARTRAYRQQRPAARNRVATRPPLIVPSLRGSAGAVTTGRQNTAGAPADGTTFPAVTVFPPRTSRSNPYHDRSRRVPASGDPDVWLATATSGR